MFGLASLLVVASASLLVVVAALFLFRCWRLPIHRPFAKTFNNVKHEHQGSFSLGDRVLPLFKQKIFRSMTVKLLNVFDSGVFSEFAQDKDNDDKYKHEQMENKTWQHIEGNKDKSMNFFKGGIKIIKENMQT